MQKSPTISSGEWKNNPAFEDYRSEWLTDVLVERATWNAQSAEQFVQELVADVKIAGPGYVWLRFWLKEDEQVVEKYFNADGEIIGFYAPICMPLRQEGSDLHAQTLALAIWYDAEGRLTILGEDNFEKAAKDNTLAPIEVEHAEHRIRELTLGVLNRNFPPGLVRNFSISVDPE